MTELVTTDRGKNAIARRNNYWIAIREAGKEARLSLTDAIAEFNLYEDAEGGSTAPERSFSNFTRSIYAPFGLNKKQVEDAKESRDDLDVVILDALRLIEGKAAQIIRKGIAAKAARQEIKQAVKDFANRIARDMEHAESGYFTEVVQ